MKDKELNTLVVERDKPQTRKLFNQVIGACPVECHRERELLDHKDVKVYTLVAGGIDINTVDSKQGIIVPLFDDLICKMKYFGVR